MFNLSISAWQKLRYVKLRRNREIANICMNIQQTLTTLTSTSNSTFCCCCCRLSSHTHSLSCRIAITINMTLFACRQFVITDLAFVDFTIYAAMMIRIF